MSAARFFIAVLLPLLLAAPAQAQSMDSKLADDLDYCHVTWPDDQSEQALCLFKQMIRRHSMQGFEERYPLEGIFDDAPLQCANYPRKGYDLHLSCSSEQLNIAGSPSVARPPQGSAEDSNP